VGGRTRIAVIGSTGQLGSDLVNALANSQRNDVLPLSHEHVEVCRQESVRNALVRARPQIIVNCAAFVRVDDCEDQVDTAFQINSLGALHVARACAEIDALCVYISTDYVFDGTKGTAYVENDLPCPINVYGASKLAGEYLVRQAAPRWLIARVASLFGKSGARGKGGNFIEAILEKATKNESLHIVNDVWMSPTHTRDAADALAELLQVEYEGVIHLTNAGACTWYEFGKAALELVGLNVSIDPVRSTTYRTRARRPANSALASKTAQTILSRMLPTWEEALQNYLIEKRYLAA